MTVPPKHRSWRRQLAKISAASFLWVALAAAGCEDSDLPRLPDGAIEKPVRLTSDEELAAFEREFSARVEQNRARRCPRPVLRGEPLPGEAAPLIASVVEGTIGKGPCAEALQRSAQDLERALFELDPAAPDKPPSRLLATRNDALLPQELGASCLKELAAMREAVRRADGCSPYLPGLRGQPSYLGLVRIVRLSLLESWRDLDAGRTKESLERSLDTLRFLQDFQRGGTSLIETIVGASVGWPHLRLIERALSRPEPLGEALLHQIERELGLLCAGQPHPSDVFSAEELNFALFSLLPVAKGPAWSPPGGWGAGAEPPTPRSEFSPDEIHPNDVAVLTLEAYRRLVRSWARACPAGSLPAKCRAGLKQFTRELAQKESTTQMVGQALRLLTSRKKIPKIREMIVGILEGVAAPSFGRYWAKMAIANFQLAALRLVAAWRLQAEASGTCPGLEAFRDGNLAALAVDPDTGTPLRIERKDDRIEVRPNEPLGLDAEQAQEPVLTGACPRRATSPR